MAVTHGHGNPKWAREEVILALELYQACNGQIPTDDDPRVVALSNELRGLPLHPGSRRKPSFRNPAGVAFKLQNIRQVATGRGLSNVASMDRVVWSELGTNPDRVRALAVAIRASVRRRKRERISAQRI